LSVLRRRMIRASRVRNKESRGELFNSASLCLSQDGKPRRAHWPVGNFPAQRVILRPTQTSGVSATKNPTENLLDKPLGASGISDYRGGALLNQKGATPTTTQRTNDTYNHQPTQSKQQSSRNPITDHTWQRIQRYGQSSVLQHGRRTPDKAEMPRRRLRQGRQQPPEPDMSQAQHQGQLLLLSGLLQEELGP